MTEINISGRIPKELEKQLRKYMETEHLERSAALRKLLHRSLKEWREDYALKLLEEGKTTVSKGAEIAGMDIWEFTRKVKERKVRWVDEENTGKDIKHFRKR